MYLTKINNQWSACAREAGLGEDIAAVRITNTTKLIGMNGPSYMLELERCGKRFHFYCLNGAGNGRQDELLKLNAGYDAARPETVFGVSEARADDAMEALRAFMRQRYAAIQTSVDCGSGLEQAKRHIRDVRLAQWQPQA